MRLRSGLAFEYSEYAITAGSMLDLVISFLMSTKRSFSGRLPALSKIPLFLLFCVQQSRTTIYEQKRHLL